MQQRRAKKDKTVVVQQADDATRHVVYSVGLLHTRDDREDDVGARRQHRLGACQAGPTQANRGPCHVSACKWRVSGAAM